MLRRALLALLCSIGLGLTSSPASAQVHKDERLGFSIGLGLTSSPASAQVHKDERLGFSIRTPAKWTQIPL